MNNKQEALLSVVIPVHNGEVLIAKTAQKILKQSYQNIELILVENNSRDKSWEVVRQLESQDSRVKALQSNTLGTSLARRRGVEEARGKYIVFSDQDDRYYSKNSLAIMVDAIQTDNVQICQFNHYQRSPFGFQRKRISVKQNRILSRERFIKREIGGILGTEKGASFTPTVWNKIYDAAMLKDAVKNIDVSLFFAEDVYLNFWAFTNEHTQAVSTRTHGVYVWNAGVGFSSRTNSSDALFQDYELTKPVMLPALENYGVDQQVIWNNHLESLYAVKVYISALLRQHTDKNTVVEVVENILDYQYIKNAKKEIALNRSNTMWDDLRFMVSDHTAQEYVDWCLAIEQK